MKRREVKVPEMVDDFIYRLSNPGTGEIHECADLAPLLRVAAQNCEYALMQDEELRLELTLERVE